MKNAWKWIVPILCLTLLLAACGAEPAAEPTAEPTEAPAAETLPPETPEPVDLMTQGVAVTIGSREYSPAEVNYLYTTQFNQVANGYYGSLFGLDASLGAQGLGELAYTGPEQEGKEYATWRDYFLDSSYLYLAQTQHLLDYAAEKGIELSEEEIAQADEDLASIESYAAAYGFESLDDFMLTFFGEGVTMEVLRTMELENALAGKAYYAFQDDMSFSDEELEEEYALLSGDYDSFSFAVYTVRARTGEDGSVSAEARAEAAAEADAIVASYQDASDVEDLCERLNGYLEEEYGEEAGLSENVAGRYLGDPYGLWLKDEARQPGDIVRLEDGDDSSVVLFLGRESGNYPTVNIRHILIMAEQGEDGGWSDEALAAASAEAERILAEWEAGERTEESFAALAQQYSQDPGSSENGGLYENVYKGQMVKEFNDFCFAEGRQPGDTGIVYGSNGGYAGYHVMFYSGEGERYGAAIARQSLMEKRLSEWMNELPEIVPGPDEGLIDPVSAD